MLLSVCTWTGNGGDGLWGTAANWSNNQVPQAGDDLCFIGSGDDTYNDLAAGTAIRSIDFQSSGFSINPSGGNNLTIASGGSVTVNTGVTSTIATDIVLSGGLTFDVSDASSGLTVSGAVSESGGSFGIVTTGPGSLTLSGTNTYTGGTGVLAGTLQVGNGAALGSGSLTVYGSAVLDLYGHSVTVTSLQGMLGSGGTITNTAGTGSQTLTVNNSTDTTYPGVITNDALHPLILAKTGTGTLTLSGTNTYTGGTAVLDGNLRIGSDSALGTGWLKVYGNAVLDLYGHNVTVTNLQGILGSGGTITNTAGTGSQTLTVNNSTDTTYPGIITNDASHPLIFAKNGTGTLTLSGTNSYTGGTGVLAGTLRLDSDSALGTGWLKMYDTAVLDLYGHNATVTNLQGFLGTGGTITNTAGTGTQTLTVSNSSMTTYLGVITNDASHPLMFVKDGTGSLTLSGTNTYTGGTAILSGTLQLGGDSALGTGMLKMYGSAVLDLCGHNVTVTNLQGILGSGGTITNTAGTGTQTLTVNSLSSTTYPGVITNDASHPLMLVKDGTGTLTLSGENTYTGGTTISNGTLRLGANAALPSGRAATINNGSILDLGGYSNTSSPVSSVIVNYGVITNGTLSASSSFNVYYGWVDANLTGTASLIKNGLNTFALAGTNSYTGGETVIGGTLVDMSDGASATFYWNGVSSGGSWTDKTWLLGNPNGGNLPWLNAARSVAMINSSGVGTQNTTAITVPSLTRVGAVVFAGGSCAINGEGSFIPGSMIPLDGSWRVGLRAVSGATGTINVTFTDNISNPTGVYIPSSHAGALVLNGASSCTGISSIYGGTVRIGNDGAFGSGTLELFGGTLSSGNANAHTLSNPLRLSGAITLGDTTNNGALTFNGSGVLTASVTLTINSPVTFAGPLSGASYGLQKLGPSKLMLNGTLTVSYLSVGGGTVELGTDLNVPGLAVYGGAALDLHGHNATVQYFSPATGGTITNTAGTGTQTLTVDNSSDTTYAGAITNDASHPLKLVKQGAGILTLTGNNTLTGGTEILAGNLCVMGTLGDVTFGGTGETILSGTGTVGDVSVINWGTVSPGANGGSGIGTLNTGSITFGDANSVGYYFKATLADGSPACDQLNVTGTVTIVMGVLILDGVPSSPGQISVLIVNDGSDPISGTFYGLPEGSQITVNGVRYTVTYVYNADGTANDMALIPV